MSFEVELKFRVLDPAAFRRRLEALAAIGPPRSEVDLYFRHPARDFAATDEALRIRRKGPENSITYKGPKIDATTKTRREVDLPLPPGEATAEAWTELLRLLDFTPVAEVRKTRCKAHVVWRGRRIEVSLDDVEGVGTFVELELIVEPDALDAARESVLSLAAQLGLEHGERRSYLELLLAARDEPRPAET